MVWKQKKVIKMLLTRSMRFVIVGISIITFELICVGAIDLAFKLSEFWK
jgi:predicted nucleotidyltransferase